MFGAYATYAAQNRFKNRTPEHARERGAALFERVYLRGMLRRLGWRLARKPHGLRSLQYVQKYITVDERHYAGRQIVPIERICGSEGRNRDFDRAFAPYSDHTRDRWVRVAAAYKRRVPLPPVELIRVGDDYFVRDGHHRISVARAHGETFIEAEVIDWVLQHADPAAGCSAVVPAGKTVPVYYGSGIIGHLGNFAPIIQYQNGRFEVALNQGVPAPVYPDPISITGPIAVLENYAFALNIIPLGAGGQQGWVSASDTHLRGDCSSVVPFDPS